jgi:hypothetical protein
MAMAIVDLLEVVEVDIDQRAAGAGDARRGDRFLEPRLEPAAVQEAGQGIGLAEARQGRLLLGLRDADRELIGQLAQQEQIVLRPVGLILRPPQHQDTGHAAAELPRQRQQTPAERDGVLRLARRDRLERQIGCRNRRSELRERGAEFAVRDRAQHRAGSAGCLRRRRHPHLHGGLRIGGLAQGAEQLDQRAFAVARGRQGHVAILLVGHVAAGAAHAMEFALLVKDCPRPQVETARRASLVGAPDKQTFRRGVGLEVPAVFGREHKGGGIAAEQIQGLAAERAT